MSHNIKRLKKERGIIKYIIYIFIGVLILSYLGFDLKKFILSDNVQNNLNFIKDNIIEVWKNYLKPIYDYIAAWLGPYISDTLERLKNHDDIIMHNVPDVMPKIK